MIERSKDYRRINRIADWGDLLIGDDYYYLIETDGDNDLGVLLFQPYAGGVLGHVNFNNGSRGNIATQSTRNAFKWIFDNTSFNIIYAAIPVEDKRVHMFACTVGFNFNYCDDTYRHFSLSRPVVDMKESV